MATVTTVGDRVKLKGDLVGTVRFIGEIEGKTGVYYGVELSEAKGKNDGMVSKRYYFKSNPKCGLFVKKSGIVKTNVRNKSTLPRVSVGDKVKYTKGRCEGVIRYIGTPFALHKKGTYYGVELERPKGQHAGTAKGVRYFKCKPKHGVLVEAEDLTFNEQKLIKTTGIAKPAAKKAKPRHMKAKSLANMLPSSADQKENGIPTLPRIDDEEVQEVLNTMQGSAQRLAELLQMKDAEIIRLKAKNQADVHNLKMQLDEQRRINETLRDQMRGEPREANGSPPDSVKSVDEPDNERDDSPPDECATQPMIAEVVETKVVEDEEEEEEPEQEQEQEEEVKDEEEVESVPDRDQTELEAVSEPMDEDDASEQKQQQVMPQEVMPQDVMPQEVMPAELDESMNDQKASSDEKASVEDNLQEPEASDSQASSDADGPP